MKEKELREHANCDYCQQRIGAAGVPFFHVVKVTSYQIDMRAIQRQQGLGMAFSPTIAMAMGPDATLAKEINRATTTMCFSCWAEIMPVPPGHDSPGGA